MLSLRSASHGYLIDKSIIIIDMIVKNLKCLFILFSYTMSHDLPLTCCLITVLKCIIVLPLAPGTWYLILDTWHNITWYLTHAITWYWYIWHNIVTPDWILLHLAPVLHCLFMIITFTGTWHDIILLPDIWYSWTSIFLNPWNMETSDIILLILYSYCSS